MDSFKTAYADTLLIDPDKRPFYSHGLVLGVAEFVQAETYLLEKGRRHNRSLHGYGTVCGLALGTEGPELDPEISVSAGLAVNPQGVEIKVPEAQCAQLNVWLANHADEVSGVLGSPITGSPATLDLHVVLCAAECRTDKVPVPTGPCQSLDRTMVASRIADDFRLELRTDLGSPAQVEEWAIRDLVALLSAIPILDDPGGLDDAGMADLVRSLIPGMDAPSGSPGTLHMAPAAMNDLLRTAFLVWATEVRPALLPGGQGCAGEPPDEPCVLLGRISFDVTETDMGPRVAGPVIVDEADRPVLLQTRLIQELMRACCAHGTGLEAAVDALAEAVMESPGDVSGDGGGEVFSPPEPFVLPETVMFTDREQTVTESQTFTAPQIFGAPILLERDARVTRLIELSPTNAVFEPELGIRPSLFRSLPALSMTPPSPSFDGSMEATFGLPLMVAPDPGERPLLRLHWAFSRSNLPANTRVFFGWDARAIYLEEGEQIPEPFPPSPVVRIEGELRGSSQNTVLITEPQELPAEMTDASRIGAITVAMRSIRPANLSVFLLKVEVSYVSNRIGRRF